MISWVDWVSYASEVPSWDVSSPSFQRHVILEFKSEFESLQIDMLDIYEVQSRDQMSHIELSWFGWNFYSLSSAFSDLIWINLVFSYLHLIDFSLISFGHLWQSSGQIAWIVGLTSLSHMWGIVHFGSWPSLDFSGSETLVGLDHL